jgi:hypothetical protein
MHRHAGCGDQQGGSTDDHGVVLAARASPRIALGSRVVIWRWSYVAGDGEAARMRILIKSLAGRRDAYRASRVYEQATHRSQRPRIDRLAIEEWTLIR